MTNADTSPRFVNVCSEVEAPCPPCPAWPVAKIGLNCCLSLEVYLRLLLNLYRVVIDAGRQIGGKRHEFGCFPCPHAE